MIIVIGIIRVVRIMRIKTYRNWMLRVASRNLGRPSGGVTETRLDTVSTQLIRLLVPSCSLSSQIRGYINARKQWLPSRLPRQSYYRPFPSIVVSLIMAKGDALLSSLRLLPQVADLPLSLTGDHKAYWNKFIGEPFQAQIGPRGKKSANGRTWTREMFIGVFCDEYYPQLSPEARDQYELILGPVSKGLIFTLPFY
jgi:hypothetical protein